jgi:hypothetical protein
MALIQFVRNYRDLSTERGFQFEFFCDRCGSGHQTEFQASATGMVTDALDVASGLLGGLFGQAANVSRTVHSAGWEQAHDRAFAGAVEAIKPHFRQCRRCSHWVDEACWNAERGLCLDCAPDLESEFSVAQTQAAIQDAQQKAAQVDYVSADKFKQTIAGTCPHCGARITTPGKFCAECGQPLSKKKHCTQCGAEVAAGVKFCPECGTAQAA